MLFEEKTCEKCGSNYDIVEATCPTCGAHNNEIEKRKINQAISWMPFWKQLGLFGFGFVILNLLSILVQFILVKAGVNEESITFAMLNNVICYSIIFISMGTFLIGNYRQIWKSFRNWVPYLVGIAAGIIVIVFSLTYNLITNLFLGAGTNDNQNTASEMMKAYPIISIILIGILGPVVEELTYRVGLFSFLKRINKWVAYAVTIAIFTFIHFNMSSDDIVRELVSLPNYIVAGLAFCFIYDRWGLASSITAHIFNNMTSVLLAILAILLGE